MSAKQALQSVDEHWDSVPGVLSLGHCVVDFEARTALWPTEERSLTATEARLLAYLVSLRGRVASRQDLLRDVWGYRGGVMSRTVKTTVGRLRAKIERRPSQPEHLLTVVGSGYRFRVLEVVGRDTEGLSADHSRGQAAGNLETMRPASAATARGTLRAHLCELMASDSLRLITLSGSPGVGKTHLAREALADLFATTTEEGGRCEVWVCETSQWSDLSLGLAEVLGIESGTERPISASLAARGRVWLLLDNFDRLAADASSLSVLRHLLSTCTQLRIVVTAYAPLNLPGEHRVEVPPLDPRGAAELFRTCAGASALEGYADQASLDGVLALLDGLPLAIEMAAAWASLLTPEELSRRLEEQLDLLHSQRGDACGHHSSLQSAFMSAWQLLSDAERWTLSQLSVFEGSFSFQAAEAVVAPPNGYPILPVLRRLVLRSLLQPVPPERQGGAPSYRLLHAVRELASARDERQAAEERHARWFAGQASGDALDSLRCLGLSSPFASILERRVELRAALRWAGRNGRAEWFNALARLLLALERCRGPLLTCEQLLEVAALDGSVEQGVDLRIDRAETLLQAGEVRRAGSLLENCKLRLDEQFPSLEHSEHGVRLGVLRARVAATIGSGDPISLSCAASESSMTPQERGWALTEYGVQLLRAGRGGEARAQLELAVELLRATGFRSEEARALEHLGRHALHRARPLRARSYYDSALALAQDTGSRGQEAMILNQLAELERLSGNRLRARGLLRDALRLRREFGDRSGQAETHVQAARICQEAEEYSVAQDHLEVALGLSLELAAPGLELPARLGLGELHLVLGRTGSASRHLSLAAQLAEEQGRPDQLARTQLLLAELDYLEERVERARERSQLAIALLKHASLRTELVDALQRTAACESALGDHERAEGLVHRALAAEELSRADGPATLVGPVA